MAEPEALPTLQERRRRSQNVRRAEVIGTCDDEGCTAQRLGQAPETAVLMMSSCSSAAAMCAPVCSAVSGLG